MACFARPLPAVLLVALFALAGCLDSAGDATGIVPPTDGEDPPVENETNLPPIPRLKVEKSDDVRPGEAVVFDANGSSDPDNDTLSFTWDFGDGGHGEGERVAHVYDRAGRFTVVLRAEDGRGGNATLTTEIVVAPIRTGVVMVYNETFTGRVEIPNPAMDELAGPYPLVGGARLSDFQNRSLAGRDHVVIDVDDVPTYGMSLAFTASWGGETVDHWGQVPDLDLYVFDSEGRLLPAGFSAATGVEPEVFVVDDAVNVSRGSYKALVLLYAGHEVPFTLGVSLLARAEVVPPEA
ncbi:MAG: PKD domain-containing protein [Euryarchaeota archaeon]|nr:PKD domain-containing protein [Euryarchaeota archaeon]